MKTKVFFKCVIMSIIALFFTPNSALAETFVFDGITYSTESDAAEVRVKSVPNQEDIVIPESVFLRGKKYTVRVIDTSAFENCKKLISLTLPPTLTYFLGYLDKWTYEKNGCKIGKKDYGLKCVNRNRTMLSYKR